MSWIIAANGGDDEYLSLYVDSFATKHEAEAFERELLQTNLHTNVTSLDHLRDEYNADVDSRFRYVLVEV